MSGIGAGVDVSKAFLDVAVHDHRPVQRFTNDADGFTGLIQWLRGFDIGQVILEATGGYEQAVLDALYTAACRWPASTRDRRVILPRPSASWRRQTGLTPGCWPTWPP